MNKDIFWNILGDILNFGEFIIAIPNAAVSANIVGKISVGRDGREIVIEKEACHCHVHLEPAKISHFTFTYIDTGFGKEPCCELITSQNETVLRLYLRGNSAEAKIAFAEFAYAHNEFVKGVW